MVGGRSQLKLLSLIFRRPHSSLPSRPVPSRPSRRPVPSRPSRPAESMGLRTLMTISPSPVHPGGPGPPGTWILSNHLQFRPLAGTGYRAGTAEDTVTRTAKGGPLCSHPDPASRLEPRGRFPAGLRPAGVLTDGQQGTGGGVPQGCTPRGYTPGVPTTPTALVLLPLLPCFPASLLPAPGARTGLWAQEGQNELARSGPG